MNFEPIAHSEQCRRAADSSHIVVADVRKSTVLTQSGQQREVNLVGAACIAAIRNLFPLGTVPYVFGGDGATFLVENNDLEKCMDALKAVQNMATRNLNISLRIGSVSLREIRQLGADVLYGSVKSGEEELIMFLRGDGIGLADRLIKQRDRSSEQPQKGNSCLIAPIEGLACRLLPFKSRRGAVVSFIVDPHVRGIQQDALFEELFEVLRGKEPFDRYCPVQSEHASHQWLSPHWKTEAAFNQSDNKISTKIKSLFKHLMKNIITKYVFAFDKFNGITGAPSRYLDELPKQCDWVKASGALYLILDMNPDEQKSFQQWLDSKEREGVLTYGSHSSDAAILTCHLHSSSHQRHFHFVDNSNGGLTAASIVLKSKKTRTAN